jgi:hypothetical protein
MSHNATAMKGAHAMVIRPLSSEYLQASESINFANETFLIVKIVLASLPKVIEQFDESCSIITKLAFDTILHNNLVIDCIFVVSELSVIVEHNDEEGQQKDSPNGDSNDNQSAEMSDRVDITIAD